MSFETGGSFGKLGSVVLQVAGLKTGNHFHLLPETPEPNLVSGMRILLGSYAQAWNRRRSRKGHLFQGRYKSISVTDERAFHNSQFRIVADYIHLNPAQAGLAPSITIARFQIRAFSS